MYSETKDIQADDLYKLLVGSVLPRPIAWVGSLSEAGTPNLAPFSFFNVVSVDPTVIAISILNKSDGSKKDSLINIVDTQCFSVSMVSHKNAKAMSISSEGFDAEINEFEMAGLTETACTIINSVRFAEADVSFECTLREVQSFGNKANAGNLVLADVVAIHVDDLVVDGFKIDSDKIDLIARLGGPYYSTSRDRFIIE